MAESYGFFNYDQNVFNSTGEYDRSYDAEEFCQYFALFIGDGVFADPMDQLQVRYSNIAPFNVTVNPGWAFIEGHWYHNDASKTITIPANTQANAVWHRICVRLNKQARTISLVDIQQAPSMPPTNTNTYHDLVLAEIQVRANANKLYASDIADTRANETKCGFVAGVIDQIDAEGMFNQLEAQFNEWFANIKSQFGDDALATITQNITTLQSNVKALQQKDEDLQQENDALANRVKALETSSTKRSHVGQIIISTTLGTEEEVIAEYGGTSWRCLTGRFLYGASPSDAGMGDRIPAGATGGSEEVTLTAEQMPAHAHSFSTGGSAIVVGANTAHPGMPDTEGFMASADAWFSGTKKNTSAIASAGGGRAHNNMPPYMAVYIWERTA